MAELLVINKLNFGDTFKNFNISFPKEKLIYFSGKNNCGKTTLLRTIDRKIYTNNNIFINEKEINEYDIRDYYNRVQVLIPNEIVFINNTVEEEIAFYNKDLIDEKELIKNLKLTKYKKTQISNLDTKNKIKLQLLLSLLKKPKLLLLDDIMSYFNKEEVEQLNKLFKDYIKKNKTTIIITTINLENTINSDYLIIIDDNKIILEGKPLEILGNDNIINKVGLDLPFMIDLTTKLKDYTLVKEIEIDKDKLINKLWK